ncbi:hypothetical protein OH784_03820 [Ectobacillus funiculus]|uniref:hypothetical protein n=1 Tax=Ectobacillus funiculus TaxID=137993 RepID=UPI00397E6723
MTWLFIVGITLVVLLMSLYEWPRINSKQKKEKLVFIMLVVAEWLLAIFLLFNPHFPGPTKMMEAVFQPISRIFQQ